MSFFIVPPNIQSSALMAGVSLPDLLGFAVQDDGDGGDIYLNGLGVVDPTVTGAYDLETTFTAVGLLFRSIPLMRAFRRLYGTPSDPMAEAQFVNFLDINMFPTNGTDGAVCGLPTLQANASVAPSVLDVPFLHLQRPAGETSQPGIWRVELRLRHSITN